MASQQVGIKASLCIVNKSPPDNFFLIDLSNPSSSLRLCSNARPSSTSCSALLSSSARLSCLAAISSLSCSACRTISLPLRNPNTVFLLYLSQVFSLLLLLLCMMIMLFLPPRLCLELEINIFCPSFDKVTKTNTLNFV